MSTLVLMLTSHTVLPMSSPRCHIITLCGTLEATKETLLTTQKAGHVVKLNLSYNGLEKLPEDFFDGISNIVALNLARNKLQTLPRMESLVHLEILNLEGNNFTVFPAAIFALPSLTTLNLSFNNVTTVPEAIGALSLLRSLNLMMNRLTKLPETIGSLAMLEEFYVSHNQLARLPEAFGGLTRLKILTLNDNALQTLPVSLTSLTRLRSINVANNPLNPDLERLRRFSILETSGTKIIGLPKPGSGGAAGAAAAEDLV